ncbi:GNAT family N-acetyltransferase [uncultured Sphingomonas sp.]|uniref:GNAT family N-acetyltransferase n=1 Tax=uncultured Sphingomonas sp. TaxID=158754 RepID=UPI0035CA587A
MFARTKRLTLRPGWPEDAPALARAIGHEAVVTNLARAPWPYAEHDARDWLGMPRVDGEIALLIFDHEEAAPRLVGGIGLHPVEGGGREIGYWLTPLVWGRGYATEAGRQVIEIGRHALRLKRVVGRHFIDNPGSGRVLAKLGFRPIGTAMLHSRARGREDEGATMELDFGAAWPGTAPIAA